MAPAVAPPDAATLPAVSWTEHTLMITIECASIYLYICIVSFIYYINMNIQGCFTIKQPVLNSTPDAQELPSPVHSSGPAHATPPASFYLASTPNDKQASHMHYIHLSPWYVIYICDISELHIICNTSICYIILYQRRILLCMYLTQPQYI